MPLIPKFKSSTLSHIQWLRRIARFLAPGQDEEDLVQETLIRTGLSDLEQDILAPRAYVTKVARNLVIDRARFVQARGGIPLALHDLDDSSVPWVAPDQESALLLKQVILALPLIYRDTFVLNRFIGLTYAEIAQRQGITVKAVEYRMSRALALCQEALRD